jgi:hypothetical protein
MRSLVVIVAHEVRERPLQRRAASEVSPPEGDAPVLLQDRALQALDEAVGPRMARLSPGVAQAQRPTRLIEGSLNSGPPSVSTRRSGQPARRKSGTRTSRKKAAASAAVCAGSSAATP